jgi:transglutaminase-like putative cysteine protease
MIFRIRHQTRYASLKPVSVGHNEAWLTPRDTAAQRCLDCRLQIEPEPSVLVARRDYFQNLVTQFAFNQGYTTLTVTAFNEVETLPRQGPASMGPAWEELADPGRWRLSDADFDAYEFAFDSARCRTSPELALYAAPAFTPGRPILEAVADLMGRLHADFRYEPASTTISTPVEQVFRQRRGVCQDFAHLMISMLRSLGLSARYVSGYLRTAPPPGRPRLVGADASHAWVSVYCGALGWVDADPTNNQFPWSDHVTIAWGRDYTDVTPLKGVYIGGNSLQMHVCVDVA